MPPFSKHHRNISMNLLPGDEIQIPLMEPAELVKVAVEHGGYESPELNDQLYLHYKGYRRIENLDPYINLKALWLDSNGFDRIENLDALIHLRCLYLQRNLLTTIEHLETMVNLVHLDISENRITVLSGLSSLTNLISINAAKNILTDYKSISHLQDCISLSSIDLSYNELKGEDVISIFANMKSAKLTSVNFKGNPIISEVDHFRKKIIVAIPSLRYLDRPIFDMERAAIEAWTIGGRSAELKVKKEWQAKKQAEEKQAMQDFRNWQAKIRAKKLKELEDIKQFGPSKEQKEQAARLQESKTKRLRTAAIEAERERQIYQLQSKNECNNTNICEGNTTKKNGLDHTMDEKSNCGIMKTSTLSPYSHFESKQDVADNVAINDIVIPRNKLSPTKDAHIQEEKNKINEKKQIKGEMDVVNSFSELQVSESRNNVPIMMDSEEHIPSTRNKNLREKTEKKDYRANENECLDDTMQSLVQESLLIYRSHRSVKNQNIVDQSASCLIYIENKVEHLSRSSVREDSLKEKSQSASLNTLVWNKEMDVCLSKFVDNSKYDFTLVASKMQVEFCTLRMLITSEDCRMRWFELDSLAEDANNSKRHEEKKAKIFLANGKQISFEELQHRAFSEQNQFLCPPQTLPNIDDWSDNDENESDVCQNHFLQRDTIWSELSQENKLMTLD